MNMVKFIAEVDTFRDSLSIEAQEFLDELKEKYPDKAILLVTHGDVCKAIYAYFNNVTDANEINLCGQENCEIRKYVIN